MKRVKGFINCKQCGKKTSKYKGSHYNKIKQFCSNKCAYEWRRKFPKIGKDNPCWKGEKATYSPKHIWLHRHYGKANKCENKNCTYKNPKRYEWANISGKYLRERSDYKMLCPSCHRREDWGDCCIKGHKFDKENTIVNPNTGWRSCKICRKERRRERWLKYQL